MPGVTLCAVNPYPPQEPYKETPYPGQPSGPPYPGLPPAQPVSQFYGPPPHLLPPQPPRPTMSTAAILAIVFGALAVLCVGGGIVSTLAGDTTPEPAATASATRPAAAVPTAATSAAPTMATMPNLVGKNAAVASDELERLGFTNIKLGSVDKNDTIVILPENWKVAEQSHAAGQTIPTDTLLVLGCTKQR